MDNLEEGGVRMDNLGKKRGSGKIFIAVTRKQQVDEDWGGGWGGGALPTLAHPFVIRLLALVCTWPEQPGINGRRIVKKRTKRWHPRGEVHQLFWPTKIVCQPTKWLV